MTSKDRGRALDEVNESFHDRYEKARDPKRLPVPVIVLLGDELVFFYAAVRKAFTVTPRAFHLVKSVAHAPIALYAALHPADGSEPDLSPLRKRLSDALRSTAPSTFSHLGNDVQADAEHVLRATLAFVDKASAARLDEREATLQQLETFAGELRNPLLRLTSAATDLQLHALHDCVEDILCTLDEAERHHLQVVVAGQHQARARSLGMQYFRKRFDEPEDAERRVAYAENITKEEQALELVATRRLDTKVARAFFGDPHRLQRDVLGDAVAALLEKKTWPLI